MIKEFVMKRMMKSQLKGMPEEQQQMFMKAFENNPELFEKIAKEIKAAEKAGGSQMAAAMKVMRKYQNELRDAFQS